MLSILYKFMHIHYTLYIFIYPYVVPQTIYVFTNFNSKQISLIVLIYVCVSFSMCTQYTNNKHVSHEKGDRTRKICSLVGNENMVYFPILMLKNLILLSISYKMQNKITSFHSLHFSLSLSLSLPKIAITDTLWYLFTFWMWILAVYPCLCA